MAIQVRQNNDTEPFVLDDTAEVLDNITLGASQGQALTIGAVLGEVTATPGTYTLVNSDAADGSQMPKLILATPDVASDASTQTVSAYSRGLFDENQLVFGGTVDLTTRFVIGSDGSFKNEMSMRDALRMFNIRVAPGISVSAYQNPVL